jgi:hypothetical protein
MNHIVAWDAMTEDERDAIIFRLAKERSADRGTVSLEDLVEQFERLHGEPLDLGEEYARYLAQFGTEKAQTATAPKTLIPPADR